MTLASDYSRAKRFRHWFLTGRTLGDPRFRNCQSPPRNLQRDERGRRFFFPEGSTVPIYVYDMRPALERARRAHNDLLRQGFVLQYDPPAPIEIVLVGAVFIAVLVLLIRIH
ncbi:MAG: hypothetical protein Q7S48_01475 [bacterium]|nr:hypothetical protein [bacterium]